MNTVIPASEPMGLPALIEATGAVLAWEIPGAADTLVEVVRRYNTADGGFLVEMFTSGGWEIFALPTASTRIDETIRAVNAGAAVRGAAASALTACKETLARLPHDWLESETGDILRTAVAEAEPPS